MRFFRTFEPRLDSRSIARRTIWASSIEGAFTQCFLNWTSGSVLTGFMLYLGAGPLALGLVAGMPQLAQLFNPLTAMIAPRLRNRRKFLIFSGGLGRVIWFVPFLLPLWIGPGPLALGVTLAVVAVSNILQNSCGLVWVSLMADTIPMEIRGRYFGFRAAAMGMVGMLANLAAGWYLDRASAPGSFQMIFIVALLMAFVGIWTYAWYGDTGNKMHRQTLRESLAVPLRDPNFRRFLNFSLYWQMAVMMASPFVIPYFLQYLHLTFFQVAIWTAISSLAALITSPLWGKVGDTAGHKSVLMITTVLAGTLHPLCWMLATPGHPTFIWISSLMDALAWGGINPAMFNLTLGTAPARHRVAYIAVLNLATGLTGFIAGTLSGPLLLLFNRLEFDLFSFHWSGYHTLFLVSGILRAQAWRLLRRVDEPRAWGARRLLLALRSRSYAVLARPFARDTT